MTTILRASPRGFVSTPAIDRVAVRALRYLQSGYSVHLRGPAGVGKTTLALHLADLLTHPIMLLFGDDDFKSSDLIGNQSGYTRKKVVDNFIHSVVKVEDELRQNWVDSRLTLACREGFTLVYDEFNRSRPEVNNVLLSALEEKLLVLPPSNNRAEYIRVHPNFRAIFTSNPDEYCGVHATQDALLDRLITIQMPEPDELTQQEIVAQKMGLPRDQALLIVRLVQAFRRKTSAKGSSGLRPCIMLGKICQEHKIPVQLHDPDFRDICQDILLSRTNLDPDEAKQILWHTFNHLEEQPTMPVSVVYEAPVQTIAHNTHGNGTRAAVTPVGDAEMALRASGERSPKQRESVVSDLEMTTSLDELDEEDFLAAILSDPPEFQTTPPDTTAPLTFEQQAAYDYLQQSGGVRIVDIEKALGINRFQAVDILRTLMERALIQQEADRTYVAVQ